MPNYVSLEDAKSQLGEASRVLVIGLSGGGKTTFAMRCAERFSLSYISIDRDVRWLPGWHARDKQEQRARIADLISQERWVMDGTSPSSFDLRLPRTDLIIWVRVSRLRALWSLAWRVLTNYGQVRVAMAPGCPEPLPDREFLSYIWNFDRDTTPKVLEQIVRHGPNVPLFEAQSRRQLELLL